MIVKRALFEAVPNVSEGRDRGLIELLAGKRHVIDVHSDADHNRTVLTLVGADLSQLSNSLFEIVALAAERIDLRLHSGVHPRVGAADVVPFVPLGRAAMSDAIAASMALGERIWTELGLPVYFYGEAASGGRLADIRAGRMRPDLGQAHHPMSGAVCVGARELLIAFNVTFDALPIARARRIAALMREQSGVQALAFQLAAGRVQVSMNLTRPDQVSVLQAYERACHLAQQRGEPELVGLCPAAFAGPGCDGGLLEARLASCAARDAALTARQRSDEEMARVADRLEAESRSMKAIPLDQEALLAGAERAGALTRVLWAAGLATPELEAMLAVATAGFRAALTPATAARFGRRVALIDGWLDSAG